MNYADELLAILREERAAVAALDAERLARSTEAKWAALAGLERMIDEARSGGERSHLRSKLNELMAYAEANRALLRDAEEMVSAALGRGGDGCYDRRARRLSEAPRGGKIC
jgi:hypothetical protein